MKRDLYVYVPPDYDPSVAYPLLVYFHSADFDEHSLIGEGIIEELDAMIVRGECPPVVVACPDGNYSGQNWLFSKHSLFVNGRGGRLEDHVMQEVIPFVRQHYSILPNREAHAILGASAGGYGSLGMAIKHRDFFAMSATLSSPINLRFSNPEGSYARQFDPSTYRWLSRYDPDTLIATFGHGLRRVKAKGVLGPIYGDGPDALALIARDNPADLLFTTGLRPGELAIYLRYGAPGRIQLRLAQPLVRLARRRPGHRRRPRVRPQGPPQPRLLQESPQGRLPLARRPPPSARPVAVSAGGGFKPHPFPAPASSPLAATPIRGPFVRGTPRALQTRPWA